MHDVIAFEIELSMVSKKNKFKITNKYVIHKGGAVIFNMCLKEAFIKKKHFLIDIRQ